jgi:DNA-binding NarL/FixJ family response regulator
LGYVVKTEAAVDIVQAIHTALHGAISVGLRVTNVVVQASLACATLPPDPLTSRERESVQCIAEGQTTRERAVHLELGVQTVASHRINRRRKLDMHETAILVRSAIHWRRSAP